MKTLKQYEDSERLVKLIEWDNGNFSVTIITNNNRTSTGSHYIRRFWAERKFIEYRDYPLKTIKGL